MNLIYVFIGGGAGSLIRFFLNKAFPWQGGIPFATLIANVTASIVVAVLLHYATSTGTRLLLITGFCGGLSTFSTFSLESVRMAQQGDWGMVLLNILLNVIVCFGAIMLIARQENI